MPLFGSVKRRDLIGHLLRLGLAGPYSGGRHQFMVKDDIPVRVPNPHQTDIGRELLGRILCQADISRDEWEKL